MNHKKTKSIIIFVLIILMISMLIAFVIDRFIFNKHTIKTQYGDVFNVEYDDFKTKSIITSPDSKLYYTSSMDTIKKEDFIGLENTSTLKVYRFDGVAIFDDGEGFELLTDEKDIDSHPKVAEVVFKSILSDSWFFQRNIKDFVNSRTYCEEGKRVLDLLIAEDYGKLSDYGLTEKTINDSQELNKIKQAAEEAAGEKKKD